ncbi:hypothetical protein HDU76_008896, partial [Blyttiomyces sp. JEL0837]
VSDKARSNEVRIRSLEEEADSDDETRDSDDETDESDYDSQESESNRGSVKEGRTRDIKVAHEGSGDRVILHNLDIHGLVLSYKLLQRSIKVCIVGLMAFVGMLDVALGALRPDRAWVDQYDGITIVGVSGIIAALMTILWVCTGHGTALVFAQVLIVVSIAMGGHAFLWGCQQSIPSYATGILVGGLGIGVTCSILLVLMLVWGKFRVTSFSGDGVTFPTLVKIIAFFGWIIFMIGFPITVKENGMPNPTIFAAELVLSSAVPAMAIIYIISCYYDSLGLRSAIFALACLALFVSGGIVNYAAIDLIQQWGTRSSLGSAGQGAILAGIALCMISYIVLLMHRSLYFVDIEVTKSISNKLVDNPDHRGSPLAWLHTPTGSFLSTVIKITVSVAVVGWFVYISGLGLLNSTDLPPPRDMHHVFTLAMASSIIGISFFIYLQWTIFAGAGVIAAIAAFASGGAALFNLASSNILRAAPILTLIGCVIALFALIVTVTILLHRDRIFSTDELTTASFIIMIGAMSLGWVLTIVSLGLRKGTGIPGYLQVSVPGGLAVLGLFAEKFYPFQRLHHYARAGNVLVCILLLIVVGASLNEDSIDIESNILWHALDLVGSGSMLLSAMAYIWAAFIYSIKSGMESFDAEQAKLVNTKVNVSQPLTESAIDGESRDALSKGPSTDTSRQLLTSGILTENSSYNALAETETDSGTRSTMALRMDSVPKSNNISTSQFSIPESHNDAQQSTVELSEDSTPNLARELQSQKSLAESNDALSSADLLQGTTDNITALQSTDFSQATVNTSTVVKVGAEVKKDLKNDQSVEEIDVVEVL